MDLFMYQIQYTEHRMNEEERKAFLGSIGAARPSSTYVENFNVPGTTFEEMGEAPFNLLAAAIGDAPESLMRVLRDVVSGAGSATTGRTLPTREADAMDVASAGLMFLPFLKGKLGKKPPVDALKMRATRLRDRLIEQENPGGFRSVDETMNLMARGDVKMLRRQRLRDAVRERRALAESSDDLNWEINADEFEALRSSVLVDRMHSNRAVKNLAQTETESELMSKTGLGRGDIKETLRSLMGDDSFFPRAHTSAVSEGELSSFLGGGSRGGLVAREQLKKEWVAREYNKRLLEIGNKPATDEMVESVINTMENTKRFTGSKFADEDLLDISLKRLMADNDRFPRPY